MLPALGGSDEQTEAFCVVGEEGLGCRGDLLPFRVGRPLTQWDLLLVSVIMSVVHRMDGKTHRHILALYLLEPSRLKSLLLCSSIVKVERPAHRLLASPEELMPLSERIRRLDAPASTLDAVTWLDALKPAARLQDAIGFGEKGVPVLYRTDEAADVYKIEGGIGVSPCLRAVFDLAKKS